MASPPKPAQPRLNLVDRAIAAVWPQAGVKRLQARMVLAHYEAAKPSTQRKWRTTSGEPNLLPGQSAAALRNQVRYLERNHDITRGALNVLVNNTVGPQGIGVEFQPRKADGSIHQQYAKDLAEAWRDFSRRPEVTWQHGMGAMQRLMARTLYRDGEVLGQHVSGRNALLDHGTRVPYSVELIEPDLLPLDFDDESRGIRQGIERNAWGRPAAFHVYKGHPETATARTSLVFDTKRVSADRMLHAALRDRIGQLRGVTAFASVITRIEDIKDYEESERIAAKVAAMITGYVKRSHPDGYDQAGMEVDSEGRLVPRQMSMAPGMIIDSLAIGEELGLLDPNRPNPNLVGFREGQLRAFAAGLGASFSSVARNYNGTYSAQRQELVEQWVHYLVLCDQFVSMALRPIVEMFITVADLSGAVPMPADLKPGTHDDVLYVAPSMPWIDPAREVTAWLAAVQAGFASEYEVLRKQGKNPTDVLEQVQAWRQQAQEKGLVFNSDAGAMARQQQEAAAAAAKTQATQSNQASAGAAQAVRAAVETMQEQIDKLSANQAQPVNVTVPVNVQSHAEADMEALRAETRESIAGMLGGLATSMQGAVAGAIREGLAAVPAPTVVAQAAEQPAPQVTVLNEVKVEPATVDVNLTLPKRKTTTDLTYNSAGDIVRSVGVEEDAP